MTRLIGTIPVYTDDLPALHAAHRLFVLLGEDSVDHSLYADVLFQVLARIEDAAPDYGLEHGKQFLRSVS